MATDAEFHVFLPPSPDMTFKVQLVVERTALEGVSPRPGDRGAAAGAVEKVIVFGAAKMEAAVETPLTVTLEIAVA